MNMGQNLAILRARFNYFKNVLTLLPREPLLKIIFVVAFVLSLLVGAFFLFFQGFNFLNSLGGAGVIIVQRLFYLFFMGLFLMLIFSNIIISYASIFQSEEVRFLLQYPINYSRVFMFKFLESMGLSSWAFFFIMGPFLCAFALHSRLGFNFYLAAGIFFLPLIFLAAVVGTGLTMLVLAFLPAKKSHFFIFIGAGLILALLAFYRARPEESAYPQAAFFLRQFAPYINFSHNPFWPNFWVAEGIMALTQQRFLQALFWWLLLFSNVCLGTLIVHSLAKRIYYPVWERIQSPPRLRRYARSFGDSLIHRLKFLSPTHQVMIGKDVKLFLRDPVQWSQFLIFFGLLGIYFGNLRSFSYHLYELTWKELISFLNIFATSLILASLAVRFIYPQLSLEGRSFWVLGLAPLGFKKILWQKFWLSLFFCLTVSTGLIILSNWMLQVSGLIWAVSLGLICLACISLVGLSCGLGAVFADFRVRNPAAIFSGLGGTLNLILNLLYLLLSVGIVGAIFHFYGAGRIGQFFILKRYLLISGVGVVILSLISWLLPLYLGAKALEEKEV